ncbi:MAG: hypothetical protein H7321_10105 [Bacteroidia bacterium]|nr:hypothetical protein [Bacteroidia bacterium]
MNTLFPLETFLPEGFKYYEDFLTVEEEKLLCRIISTLELKPLIFQGFEAKRKIAGFGVEYHFNSRSISAGNQIPEKFDFLLNKVSKISGISSADLAKMLITEYPPGSVINWHRDGPPFETIIGISLLSDCIFKMRPYDKKINHGRQLLTSL